VYTSIPGTEAMANELLEIVQNLNRLAMLQATRLLDSPPEEPFDRLARIACKVVKAPVALVTLVDRDRQFFKSSIGLPEPWCTRRETPLSHSFCKHVVATQRPLVLSDARLDASLRDNPAIQVLGIVAYLGIPLVTAGGVPLGSFCVIDQRPRDWTYDQVDLLQELAACVMREIELRRLVPERP
jgi:GAF domain-containing protein